MISAGEIYDYIDSIAPFSTAMSFDNVGLLIGSRSTVSETVMLSLDVTSEVIEEAVSRGAKIILTHHPVIFNPLKSLKTDSIPYLAVKNDITVISAHTNLDIAVGGVNDTLAEALGIISENHTNEDCQLFGELAEETDVRSFALKIKGILSCGGLRYTERKGTIQKAAVACGAGGSGIFAAAEYGAHALITGEIKHHEILFAAENNIADFDLGQFHSEDLIITKLAKLLSGKFPGTQFEKADSDTDKVLYI